MINTVARDGIMEKRILLSKTDDYINGIWENFETQAQFSVL